MSSCLCVKLSLKGERFWVIDIGSSWLSKCREAFVCRHRASYWEGVGASIRDQLMYLPCPICCFQAFPAFYWKIKFKKKGNIIFGVHYRFCCFCFRKRQKWQFFFMPEARRRRCPRCGSVSYECNVTLWKTVKIPKIRENPTTFSQAKTFDSAVCF